MKLNIENPSKPGFWLFIAIYIYAFIYVYKWWKDQKSSFLNGSVLITRIIHCFSYIFKQAHMSFSVVFSLKHKKHERRLTCHPDNSDKLHSHIEDYHLLESLNLLLLSTSFGGKSARHAAWITSAYVKQVCCLTSLGAGMGFSLDLLVEWSVTRSFELEVHKITNLQLL